MVHFAFWQESHYDTFMSQKKLTTQFEGAVYVHSGTCTNSHVSLVLDGMFSAYYTKD